MAPAFAEYVLVEASAAFRVEWPWRHARLPLHPRLPTGLGVSEENNIKVARLGEVERPLGGRRNHMVDMNPNGEWHLVHLGHSIPIVVNGSSSMANVHLSAPSLIEPATGLSLRFTASPSTELVWSALSAAHHAMLNTISDAQPRHEGAPRLPYRWLPLALSRELSVMTDWLLEQGVSSDDTEVELAHLVAWHGTQPQVRRFSMSS